jgi:hypothetical protein
MKTKFLAAAALSAVLTSPTYAQEIETPVTISVPPTNLPINAPNGAVVKSVGNMYIWGQGGAWDTTLKADQNNTQNNGNTASNQLPAPLSPDMPLPSASSATTRGAVGYVLPSGSLSPELGSNVRTEFGASQTTANMPLTTGGAPLVYNGIALGGCSTCGSSSSNYSAQEVSAKAASDYKFDALTLTPSVTVFNSESHQDFSSGSNSLAWRDTGAKVGVDGKVDLNQQFSMGVGGSYGRAQRSVTASVGDAETSPYLANGEAKITYKPTEDLSLNGFAGLNNYDNKVPGVGTTGKVDYAPASNMYYGAGATWRFGTK